MFELKLYENRVRELNHVVCSLQGKRCFYISLYKSNNVLIEIELYGVEFYVHNSEHEDYSEISFIFKEKNTNEQVYFNSDDIIWNNHYMDRSDNKEMYELVFIDEELAKKVMNKEYFKCTKT